MLKTLRTKTKAGFTLVEIMIVVAIIALLASIAVPNFLRARKRSQATRILEDARILEAAKDQWAIETNQIGNANVTYTDVQPYLKANTPLATENKDVLGQPYGFTTVDAPVTISATSYDSFTAAGGATDVFKDAAEQTAFWGAHTKTGGGTGGTDGTGE